MSDRRLPAVEPEAPVKFRPCAIFDQTCGHCGAVFRVEVARQSAKDDQAEYCCPDCNHHVCRVNSSSAPRVRLLTDRNGKPVR